MSDTTIETIIIQTTRLTELAEFYREAFDLPEPKRFGPGHLGFQLKGAYLGFDQVDAVQGQPPGAVSVWFTVDDIDETFVRLQELGAEVKYPPTEKTWGEVLAAVWDPDGNVVGLVQRK